MKVLPIPISKIQRTFRESNSWLRGFVGGRGCIAPETKIRGVPVADIRGQSSVSTFAGSLTAEQPFLKGVANLYRVKLLSGLEVVVTDAHRFLTPEGWLPLSRLQRDSLVAIGDENCEQWQKETGRDWKDCYHRVAHLNDELSSPLEVASLEMLQRFDNTRSDFCSSHCDQQLRLSRNSYEFQKLFQSGFERQVSELVFSEQSHRETLQQHEALPLSRRKSNHLDIETLQGIRQTELHLQNDFLSAHPEKCRVSNKCETSSELLLETCLFAIQSELTTYPAMQDREQYQAFSDRSFSAWDQIDSISFERHGEFWDLHVPIANHYSACGIFHHNSGKSKIGSIDISQRARPGEPWMAISPDNNMIRETTLPTFLETVNFTKQYISHVLAPTPKVKFRTRWGGCAELVFKGAEVPDKLRGPNKAGLWFDEASIISKDAFDIAIACCRYQGKMGPVLATFTPRGFAHWTFESFYDGVDESLIGTDGCSADGLEWFHNKAFRSRPDTFLVRCSTRDNPFAPPEYYSRIAQNYSTVLAMQELEGDFVEFSGMIFRREWFSKTVEIAPAESTRVRYWDKASSPDKGCYTVGLLMARDARGIYYIEDVVRGQWSAHERNEIMLQTARSDAYKYGHSVLTYVEQEGGGDGKTVADQLIVMMSEFPIYRDNVSAGGKWKTKGNVRLPGDAKIRRAQPFAAQCEAGNIRLVLGSSNGRWHRDYCDELSAFPEYAFADSVDASSGAYNVLQRVAPTYSNQTATRSTEVAAKSRYGHTVQHSEGDSISRWSDLPWNQDNFEGQTGY